MRREHTVEMSGSMPVTIVIADDAQDYRLLLRTLLQTMADTVTVVGEAHNGEDALALIRLERPDIVIADLVMPRLNGIELVSRVRQELPQTKFILISSYTDDAYRVMAADSGADAFVTKQSIPRRLLPAVHQLVSADPGRVPSNDRGSSASKDGRG